MLGVQRRCNERQSFGLTNRLRGSLASWPTFEAVGSAEMSRFERTVATWRRGLQSVLCGSGAPRLATTAGSVGFSVIYDAVELYDDFVVETLN